MFYRIIYGMLGVAAGIFLTVKAHSVVDNTGRIDWAERFFGGAGTYTFIRVLGIFLSVFFFLYAVGLLGTVYLGIVHFIYSIFGMAS